MTSTLLHFSPHPDDELLGAPATLMAMRDAGHRVVTVACSLGRRAQQDRRRVEASEAAALAGFELHIPAQPVALSSEDDQAAAEARLVEVVSDEMDRNAAEIVVSPSPHDRHPGHEMVGRAVRDVLAEAARGTRRWWLWGLWAPLQLPTFATTFEEPRLQEILDALSAHRGELARNNYRRLLRGRCELDAVLAPELLFGFGAAPPTDIIYAELVTEVSIEESWSFGASRWFDATDPTGTGSGVSAREWLYAESLTQRFGAPGGDRETNQ